MDTKKKYVKKKSTDGIDGIDGIDRNRRIKETSGNVQHNRSQSDLSNFQPSGIVFP